MTTSSISRAELLKLRLSGLAPARQEHGIPRTPRDKALPLSFGQRGLWILDQLKPGAVDYLMAVPLRISGELDPAALRRALDAVVVRHEILRTRFTEAGGEPVQVVDPPGGMKLTEVDLRGLAREQADRRLAGLTADDGLTPFDLAAEHPVRALLAHLSDTEHVLLLTLHHIASDGWSESVLLADLDACYAAEVSGDTARLAPLPCQYADFAAWQRDEYQGAGFGKQLAYWRDKLAGLTPLDLPSDRPRGPVRDAAGAVETFTVPAGLTSALTGIGRRYGATPFMVFLAVFQTLLCRYTGQHDIAVGTPVAGRDHADLQGLIGLFLTMVTLRTDLSGDPAFTEALARVRESALDAYAHQQVPFERVIDEVAPRRDPSRTPLFQVTFQLADETAAPLAGLHAVRETVGWSSAKFDLELLLTSQPDGSLTGSLEYATTLFDAATARGIVAHYQRLLEGIAADPQARIGRLALLSDAERDRLIAGSGPGEHFPVAADESLPAAFWAQADRTPGAVAVSCGGESLTYAELDARAEWLARRLRSAGAGPGTLVGVCLGRGIDLVAALLGVLAAGAGYVPLDPDLPAERLAYMIQDAGVRLVVGKAGLTLPADGIEIVPPDGEPDAAARPESDNSQFRTQQALPGPHDVAYVLYTSGSTGRPKGVAVTHENVVRLLRSCQADFRFGSHDVWALFHSYAFDLSVWEMWGALLYGGRIAVVPYATSRSPHDLMDLLIAEQVTVLTQTPSAFRGLTRVIAEAEPLAGDLALRAVVFGGEALDPADLKPWYTRLGDRCPEMVNMYGITETTVHVTYRPIRPAEADCPGRSPIGRPLRDLRMYLLDQHLNPVPAGVPGELYVSGPGLARGYLGRPDLTASRFGPDPYADVPGARMYRSGDLARLTSDGEVEFLGRLDDQVKIRGHRIELGEIKAALSSHPNVSGSLAIAHRGDGEPDARLIAYVTVAPGRELDATALRDHVSKMLPSYMVPAVFVTMDAFPITSNGKTDRAALPDPDAYLAASAVPVALPRTPLEAAIAAAWAEALGIPEVGVHDNFFALGGDSIRAIRVVGALRRDGVDLSVQETLVHQTISELARVAASARNATNAEEDRAAPFTLLAKADRAILPPGLADAYPMAMVQAAMVYQMLADQDEHPYQNIMLFPMVDETPFDLAALRAAAALLADRHEILRTSFDLATFSEPLQLVHPAGTMKVGYDDLRGLAADTVAATIDMFTADARRTAFDISRPPLIRFHVYQTADERWTLGMVECHAVLDGWSQSSIITELTTSYRAIRDGREPAPAGGHTVRYADYIELERRSLKADADREFWRNRLIRFERVRLPETWAARPGEDSHHWQYQVPTADLEPGLRALAIEAGVPLKSVMFAAHAKVLATISGSRRFHSGLVSNGRLETHGGDLVRGMYLNTLPFGVALTGATWTDLVRQVFAEEVAVWPHRRFPLPEMQRAWGGGAPLVEVAFTYLDFHVLDRSHIDSERFSDDSPNEFALDVWTFPGVLHVAGRPDRISRANGRRLADMYRAVLEAMATDPAGDAGAAVLTATGRSQLLALGSGPAAEQPDTCVHELFERQVARDPEAVALRCADGTAVSYSELNARANRLARQLRSLGVGEESRVGVLLRRGPDLVTALLAVLKAGAAYLPLDPAHPTRRLTTLLSDTGAKVVVTESALSDRLDEAAVTAVTLDRDARCDHYSGANLGHTAGPDSLAYVIYTSGSTGTPKGVMIEHRNLVSYVCWCLRAYPPRGGSGAPLYSSVAFDLPVTSIYPALLSGQAVTLTEDDGSAGIDALITTLERGSFGLLKLTPSHLALLNQTLSAEVVRTATGRLVAGGEELDREVVTTWAQHAPDTIVGNEYGPTETTVGCSYFEGHAGDLEPGVLPIGSPIANTTMRVLDDNMELVPVGVTGELYIGGTQVARGYADQPGLTADKFVPDPYATTPGARLYRSGDLARVRADGVFEFAGRADNQVKIRGYRVELGEVEAALRRCAGLRDVAVTACAASDGTKTLAAYLVLAENDPADPAILPELLAETLPHYLIPASYVVLDAMPMTPSGKIDVATLPAPSPSAEMNSYAPPRNALENMLARTWARVLGVRRIGIHDSFVDLGSHSFVVMRVIVQLRERYNIRVSFRDFYEYRTVAELATALEAGSGSAQSPDPAAGVDGADALVWLRPGGTKPALWCVYAGSVHWYAALAEHMPDDRPVGAFEWPGATRPWPAPESVEQIAELNLTQLRRAAPRGPYHLLGWCSGSQVTSEMARRLHAEGEQVSFILVDPSVDSYKRDNLLELMKTFRRTEALLATLNDAPEDEVPRLQREAVAELKKIVDDGIVDSPIPGDDFWSSRTRIFRELLQCYFNYRHRPYPGQLHLIVGDELAAGEHAVNIGQTFAEYAERWAYLATGGIDIHRCNGTHYSVLRPPHVAGLARTVARLMDMAERDTCEDTSR
ncbi:MAG TPA: amino acid adenylation domain-containing protein [Streptosporangiaceae bacterium]|nr:amino acid adenylation domain-containing protein [Streptosporangiaceae bacterium]